MSLRCEEHDSCPRIQPQERPVVRPDTRDIGSGIARWDAYIYVPDPDTLAAEFASRGIEFFEPLQNNSDNLRGFEIKDADGYILYFGRPNSA